MQTQGEDDAKSRFQISLTSSEKTDSQIYRLKENRPKGLMCRNPRPTERWPRSKS